MDGHYASNGKKKNSRPGFNVGVVYNKLMDEEVDEYEKNGFMLSEEDEESRDVYVAKSRKRIKVKRSTDVAAHGSNLLSTEVLPDRFRAVFSFKQFNRMQSECFNQIYNEGENCVISAPTGSGKTVLFELAILNLMKNNENELGNIKILYIAPTKSLCYEKMKSWNSRFINIRVGMLTGDTSHLEVENVRKATIIITTPEKWDLLTRKWDDYSRLFDLVKLILVDEIHILKDKRGATLEVVLTRMNYRYTDIRIIAVSATIPNINDIANWLKSNSNRNNPALVLDFDDSYRQVSLKKHVYGMLSNNKNDFQKDSLYNSRLDGIFYNHGNGKPILIFCPTRASTISTAKYIGKESQYLEENSNTNRTIIFNDQTLTECANRGVLFHHAGLSLEDRRLVEEKFIDGTIKVLCSTTTLAVGVNLPAYLVIIKGTKMWTVSESNEYSDLDILQMIGRAGRPQYEDEGCAVILTDNSMTQKYEKLINGSENLESTLHLNLLEHLCAEILLKNCYSLKSTINWLKSTFFYVRYMQAPTKYPQVHKYYKHSHDNSEFQLHEFCRTLLAKLEENEIVYHYIDRYECSPYGVSLVRHYVMFDTIARFVSAKFNLTVQDILLLLSKAEEFKGVRVRHNEKRLYKEINKSPLTKFPFLTENKQSQIVNQSFQKVSLLLQYEFGGLEFPNYEGALKVHYSLVQDKLNVLKDSYRILKSMIDTFISKKDGTSLKNSLFLLRCLNGNCWEDTPMTLRQIKNVGLVSVRRFVNHDIQSLKEVLSLAESQIEYYLNLKPGLGTKILRDVALIPKIELKIDLHDSSVDNEKREVHVCLRVELSCQFKTSLWHNKRLSIDVLSLNNKGEFIDFRKISIDQLKYPKSYKINSKISGSSECINFYVNCQEVAGVGKTVEFNGRALFQKYFKQNYQSSFLENILTSVNTEKDQESAQVSSDDSLMHYLDDKNTSKTSSLYLSPPKNNVNLNSKSVLENRQILPNGNIKCNHTCRNKNVCRHICCREGIPPNSVRRKKTESIHNLDNGHYSQNASNTTYGEVTSPQKIDFYNSIAIVDNNIPEISNHVTSKLKENARIINSASVKVPSESEYKSIPATSSASSSPPRTNNSSEINLSFLGSDIQYE